MVSVIALMLCASCAASNDAKAPTTIVPPVLPTATPAPTVLALARTPTETPVATRAPTAAPTASPVPSPTVTPAPTACGETDGHMIRDHLHSQSMGRDETYRIYIPACYSRQEARRYPALYLLH